MRNLQWFFHSKEWSDRTDNYCRYIDDKLEFTEFQNIMVNRSSIPDRILDRSLPAAGVLVADAVNRILV